MLTMKSSDTPPTKRSREEWIASYERSHRNPFNRLCHFVGIPLITGSLLLFVLVIFYPALGWPPTTLFVTGWLLLFAGQAVVGTRPEFMNDWRFLFVGLSWWFAKVRGGHGSKKTNE
jgi:uncharacterized membrane protein YGL010W